MRCARLRLALTLVLLVTTWTASADAQTADRAAPRARRTEESSAETDQQRAARSLFDAGTIAFRQLRYEDALESFLQAYKLTNDPVLLFSIGMAYDRLYRLPEAVKALEAYLQAMPDAPNRAAAEERIRVISQHIDQGDREQAREPAPPPPATSKPVVSDSAPAPASSPSDDRGVRVIPQWVFWVGVGATAGLAGTLVWSGVDAANANDEYKRNPTDQLYKDGRNAEDRTNILIGATVGTAVITAVVGIFFTDFQGKRRSTASGAAPTWSAWADRSSQGVVFSQQF